MRRDDAREVLDAMTGFELARSVAAFDAIGKIDVVESIFVLMRESDGRGYPVARALTRRLVAIANSSGDSGLSSLLMLALDARRQNFRFHDLIYDVSHAVVNSDRLWHGQKCGIVAGSLHQVAAIEEKVHKTSVTYLIQAAGFVKATDVLPIFPKFLAASDDDLTFEVLQACRVMNDSRARAFLPSVFETPNVKLSELALELFCSFGSLRARRGQITGLYREVSPEIRERLIRCHHLGPRDWLAEIYQQLYSLEPDAARRSQIVTRLGGTDCARAATALVKIAADDPTPECRLVASASLRAMPANEILPTIQRGLKSPVDSYRRWAITKTGDLAPPAALHLLAPALEHWQKLSRNVLPFLVETAAKLALADPQKPLAEWLWTQLGRAEGGPIALAGLLRRLGKQWAPIGSLLYHRRPQSAAYLLQELARPAAPSSQDLAAGLNLNLLLEDRELEIRYAAASLFLQSMTVENVAKVFAACLGELPATRSLFVDLLVDRATASARTMHALAVSIRPAGSAAEAKQSKRLAALVSTVCEQISPSPWREADWADLIDVVLRHAALDDDQTLAFRDATAFAIFNFCLQHVAAWSETLNTRLCTEEDPSRLAIFAALARNFQPLVRAETSFALADRLETGAIEPIPSVVELLVECGEERAYAMVLRWLDHEMRQPDPRLARILAAILDPPA